MADHGLLLIISGPSGVGKTTITHHVEKRVHAWFSVSMTTRPKTDADREGVDYFFVTRERFTAARDAGELLEWAEYNGNLYGTPRKPVEERIAQGATVLLEIDVQGAMQVKRAMDDAFAIFVLPPSESVLLDRLRARKREDEATIQRRFGRAQHEMSLAKSCGIYDRFVVNDDLDHAIDEAVAIVNDELGKRRRVRV